MTLNFFFCPIFHTVSRANGMFLTRAPYLHIGWNATHAQRGIDDRVRVSEQELQDEGSDLTIGLSAFNTRGGWKQWGGDGRFLLINHNQ